MKLHGRYRFQPVCAPSFEVCARLVGFDMERGILWFDDVRWSQAASWALFSKCYCCVPDAIGFMKAVHVPAEAPTGHRLVIQLTQIPMMMEIDDVAAGRE